MDKNKRGENSKGFYETRETSAAITANISSSINICNCFVTIKFGNSNIDYYIESVISVRI